MQSCAVAVAAQLEDFGAVVGCQGLEDALQTLHLQLFAHLAELPFVVGLPPNDVELRTAAAALGIHFISLTSSSQCAALVEERRKDFSLQRIVGAAHAKALTSWCIHRIGVAALTHEVADDAVEECTIVETFLRKFQEVVTMERSLIVEANGDVAKRCSDFYF